MKLAYTLFALLIGSVAFGQSPPTLTPVKPLRLPEGTNIDDLADAKKAAALADVLEKEYPAPRSEGAKMLIDILRGSQLMGGSGWFGPSMSRYNFAWLAKQHGLETSAKMLPKAKFTGPDAAYEVLDRDGDGEITPFDLDWSDSNPYVMQANIYSRLFRRMDRNGDGQMTKEEFQTMFDYLSRKKDSFTADDMRKALLPRGTGGFNPGDAPSIPVLVRGLFAGEIGSITEGPALDEAAPDFTLKSQDGKGSVQLSKLVGPKPVVLVFGNFTCGPFRALYPDVDAVHKRFKDHATFQMVYVREAHPTDGWKMEQNTRMGVSAKQPTTFEERVSTCGQFLTMVKPNIPVAVDELSDPAGKAYSGMPARLYVIDSKGKVAYKSGRGPFGFKPSEMEQALAMCLVEAAKK